MIMLKSRRRMLSDMERTLNEYSVGETIKIKIADVSTDFIIVHQGMPDAIYANETYDESCKGVWVMSKDIILVSKWGYDDLISLSDSVVLEYLNGTFYYQVEDNYRTLIKPVIVPCGYSYQFESGGETVTNSTIKDVSTKIFLPSLYEVGAVGTGTLRDGAKFDYFLEGDKDTAAMKKRSASFVDGLSAAYAGYMTRTIGNESTKILWGVYSGGGIGSAEYSGKTFGVRPMFILDPSRAGWEYPEEVDDGLLITQAYDIINTDDGLEGI